MRRERIRKTYDGAGMRRQRAQLRFITRTGETGWRSWALTNFEKRTVAEKVASSYRVFRFYFGQLRGCPIFYALFRTVVLVRTFLTCHGDSESRTCDCNL